MRITSCARPQQRRRGSLAAVELLWSVPLVLIGVMAMTQYCMMLSARQHLLSASREGARVAARGADAEEVKSTVKRVDRKSNV